MLTFWLLAACTPEEAGRVRSAPTDRAEDAPGDTSPSDTSDTSVDLSPCPPEMALAGAACVDRWEAHLDGASPYDVPESGVAVAAEGVVPQGYISGEVAAAACAAGGKRLCSLDEWMRACGGPEATTYPYGDTYDGAACNDSYGGGHPVVDYFGTSDGVWDGTHMNDGGINQQPGTVDATGANPGCVTPEGVYDLHGNLHEWIEDPAGTFKGGFYADAALNGAGCGYTTTAHSIDYHDYSTGFRCCKNPAL
ncbi:MAG: SUMF1/EgtB/PvdO family nonheme iron enzyme [Pseudomonadota bacterium]|nr:SUMF1/EgtB/PvdO family nonheme iron enzyme [Pseudomonadota bacterium]